jgi:uncharacterized membrane protein
MSGEIIVAIFPSRSVLTKALDYLMTLDDIKIQRAAIVAKATSGETIVIGDDISADEGGVTGGTLGAAMTALGLVQLGALAIPGIGAIIALGAGALVGGLVGGATGRFAANLLESGFKSAQVEMLATSLEAGHPALVLEFETDRTMLARLRAELKAYRAEVVERMNKTGQLVRDDDSKS